MHQKKLKTASLVSVAILSGFIILFPFFGTKAQKVRKEELKEQKGGDTPRHKTIIIKDGDLDKAFAGLNMVNLDSINLAVQNALASVDFNAIGKNIEQSMKAINADSIRLQVDMAMKNIDMQKIQADMKKAMAESQKAMAESQKAMAEMQKSDWQKEFQKSMKEMKLNMPDMKKEMEAAQKEMVEAKVNMKGEMAKAKMEIEKSKLEITELKNAVAEMKKDGLIKEGGNIKLEWKNSHLFINGKEQSQAVSDKYRKLENISFQQDNDDEEEN